MPDQQPGGEPEYKVYRSRRRLTDRLRPAGDLRSLRDRLRRRPGRRPGAPGEPGGPPRRKITVGAVLKWVGLAALAWLLLSLVVFMISAQLEQGVSKRSEAALSSGGSLLGGSTILVLGSDQRPAGTPGAEGPGRADSITLLRVGFGSVRKLSILRDSLAEIPGHGTQKINAAYAIGGPALMIETVESYLGNGLEVNHIVELNFQDFPDLIDALGGVDITLRRCIRSNEFEGRVFRLRAGEHHLNGKQALRFARVRKNFCSPNEDDRARARRQQQVFAAMRDQMLSPSTFFRLPWVSWAAPKTLRTDLHGPGLFGLFSDLLTGGTGETRVLLPSGNGPGNSLIVSEDEKAREVSRLLGH
jgi:LCP family protein required for cell wall assembly